VEPAPTSQLDIKLYFKRKFFQRQAAGVYFRRIIRQCASQNSFLIAAPKMARAACAEIRFFSVASLIFKGYSGGKATCKMIASSRASPQSSTAHTR
jgi:hypothetical protein